MREYIAYKLKDHSTACNNDPIGYHLVAEVSTSPIQPEAIFVVTFG